MSAAASGSVADTATGVGIPLALAAGLVSFLSPCVLPLVPGYISTVGGRGAERPRARRRAQAARTEPAVHRGLLADLHPARPRRDERGRGAARPHRHAAAGRRHSHHHHGRGVPGGAVRELPELRVALAAAAHARRPRQPARRGGGVRDRVDAVHERDARRDPHAGRGVELGGRTARCCSRSTPRGSRSRSWRSRSASST